MRSHVAAFAAGVLVATAFGAQAVPRSDKRGKDRYASLDTFAQALSYITNSYVDDVDERTLMYGAIRGMVERLDAHSLFLPPRRYTRLREDTEGTFGGVGIALASPRRAEHGDDPPYPVVESVVPRSPAARAGIEPGDRVVQIGAQRTAGDGVTLRSARGWHSRLRGRAGTRVKVELLRGERSIEKVLVRERIVVPTVAHESLMAGVGYIAISRFQEATSDDVLEGLRELRRASGGKLRALILDLRGNPGGLLDQAVRVADLFLAEGTIVSVAGRAGSTVEHETAHKPGTWLGFPMVVVVDRGSASAAEIVAGALQDHNRASVIGETTYGKGSVQTFMDLKDGSGLKLTTSRYYTPSGQTLQGAGITPDIAVDPTETGTGGSAGSAINATLADRLERDPSLSLAVETIRGWLGSKEP